MATLDIYGDASDNRLQKYAWSGSPAWATTVALTPTVKTATDAEVTCSRQFATQYFADRGYLKFDVSPFQAGGEFAGATISAVTLNVICSNRGGTTDLTFWYYDWGTTLANTAWVAVSGLTAASASQTFASTGAKAIALTNLDSLLTVNGRLMFALDDETTTPVAANYASVWSVDKGTTYRPYITVTYEPAAAGGCPRQSMYLARMRNE